MAVTLIATAGATNANSYCDVSTANAYFEERLYTDVWDEQGDEDKAKALIMSSRQLDQWFDWYGGITNLTQALLWPRMGVLRPGVAQNAVGGDPAINDWGEPFGTLLDPHTIPTGIVYATAEQALALLTSNRTADSDVETQNLRSLTAGPVSLTFGTNTSAKPIPDVVMRIASDYGIAKSRSGSGSISMLRG